MRSLLHSTSCASQFFHAFTLDVTELVGPSSLTHITPRCSTLRHPHYFLTVLPYATHTTPHTTPHCTHLRHPPYSPLSSPTPPNYSRLLRHLCYALFSPTFITTPLFAVRLLTLYSSPSRTTPHTTPHTTPPHAVLLRTLYSSAHCTPPHTVLLPTLYSSAHSTSPHTLLLPILYSSPLRLCLLPPRSCWARRMRRRNSWPNFLWEKFPPSSQKRVKLSTAPTPSPYFSAMINCGERDSVCLSVCLSVCQSVSNTIAIFLGNDQLR